MYENISGLASEEDMDNANYTNNIGNIIEKVRRLA